MAGAADLLLESEASGLHQILPGMVVAFRNRDVRALASDPAIGNVDSDLLAQMMTFIGYDDPTRGFVPVISRQVFAFNPPLHRPARRILARQMTPANRFDALASELLESILERLPNPFDLCSDLSYRFAAMFFGTLVGLDDDEVNEVQRLAETMSAVFLNAPSERQVEQVSTASEEYVELVRTAASRTLERGESHPLAVEMLTSFRDDLDVIGMSGAPRTAGDFAAGNLFDGFHTAGVGIANSLTAVIARPDVMRRIRSDPDIALAAYDEATRLAPPLILTNHRVLRDTVHDEIEIPAGTLLVLHWGAANRDPMAFEIRLASISTDRRAAS